MMAPGSTRAFELPAILPVMLLEHLYLLPGGVQPLFIFEERYRLMLDHALRTDRLFAIGERKRDGTIRPVLTAGLITSSVRAADGTSQLVLQGVHRMRITGWLQEKPFLIAAVEPFQTDREPAHEIKRLASEVEEIVEQFTAPELAGNLTLLRQLLRTKNDAAFTCDLIASLAVRRRPASRAILEERRLVRRLEILLGELRRDMA